MECIIYAKPILTKIKIMKYIKYLLPVFLLSGCSNAKLGENFIGLSPAPKGKSTLYIYHLNERLIRVPTIFVDNKMLTDLPRNSYYKLQLSPGKYSVKAKWSIDVGILPVTKEIILNKDQNHFIRLSSSIGYDGGVATGSGLPIPTFDYKGYLIKNNQATALEEMKLTKEILK